MNVLYIHLGSDEHIKESDEICGEPAEEFLRRTLSTALSTDDKYSILALDFEDIAIFKIGAVRRTLGWLAKNARTAVCLVGLNSEIAFHIIKESDIPTLVAEAGNVWLLLEKTGLPAWFGLPFSTDLQVLNVLLDGQVHNVADIDSPTIESIAKASPLFSIDSDGLIRRSIDYEALLSNVQSTVERRLAASIEALGIRTDGHYKLPSGLHTNRVFQTSLLLNDGRVLTRIAMEIARRLRYHRIDMLVSNSLCAYVLANEVASLLESHPTVLEVYGYPEPRVSLSNRTCADRRVMIISDIVSSGTSITNLRSQLDQLGARVLGAIAAIDIGGAADRIDAEALLSFPDKQFTRFTCPQCQSGIAYQVIDPFTSMAVSLPSSTEEVSPVLSSEEFWELVLENDALREGHFSFNGHHFSVFIETTRMLKNATTTRRIAAAALQYYAKRALMFDCIVFPVHPGAVAFARAIWDAMRAASERPAPLLVPASRSPEGGHIIPPSYSESMRNASVLVVDDGVNFGDTLAGLYFAVSEFTPIIECCVFVDRLSSFYRRKLAAVLQGSKLTAVYRLAIPAVHKARCPICKERRGLQRLLTSSVGEEIRKSAQSRLAQLEIRPIDPDSQLTRSDRTTGDPVFAE